VPIPIPAMSVSSQATKRNERLVLMSVPPWVSREMVGTRLARAAPSDLGIYGHRPFRRRIIFIAASAIRGVGGADQLLELRERELETGFG